MAGNFSLIGKGEPILGYETLLFEPKELRGTPTTERLWLAPALNCRQLRHKRVDLETRAARMNEFERVAIAVMPGEPNAELDHHGRSLTCGALLISLRQGTHKST